MSRLLSLFGLLAGVGIVGCGGVDHVKTTAPVTGKVVFAGAPVKSGTVMFSPLDAATNQAKSATGDIRPDGTFTLSTYVPNDGAMLGKHRVVVGELNPADPLPGKLPENFEVEVKASGNDVTLELVK